MGGLWRMQTRWMVRRVLVDCTGPKGALGTISVNGCGPTCGWLLIVLCCVFMLCTL